MSLPKTFKPETNADKLWLEELERFIIQQTKQSLENDTDKEIAEYLQCLKSKVEEALLSNPLVDDCAVLIRETATRQPKLVAYIVSSLPISPEQIQSQLQGTVPKALLPKAYVPVSTIPLTDTGQVDEAALASLEVIDSDLMRRIEEQLESLSEIERGAVVVEPQVKNISRLHLQDLLSNSQAIAVEDSQPQILATPPSEKIENKRSSEAKKLAISYGEPLQYPEDAPKTLGEVLQRAAQKSTKGIIYIQSDGTEKVQSYRELLQDAQRILAGLKKLGLKPQDKVIFQLEHNQDFIPAFWGCMLGGFVPVPISIAPAYEQVNSTTSKLQNTWQMLGKPLVLTSASLAPKIRGLSKLLNLENFQVEAIDKLHSCELDCNWHNSQPEDLAILLLTSGSTGTPKAIVQSHRSLISCGVGIAAMNGFTPEDVWLHWVPLDHVGGIVMCHIKSVYLGCQQIHAPTGLVLQQPTRWLDWIERYRATITWAPNFAYGLLNEQLEKLKTQATPTWDLSSMRFIINGAESIVAKTARRFLQLLESYQLPATAMHPAWGMAETSSGVTYSDNFLLNSTTDEQKFVEVGAPIPGFAMRIVDAQNQVVEEETIGRLQVKGASVTSGYYQNPQVNQEAFTLDSWFNTGDLGFLRQGCLTITGRQKDVIIINGLNYYCHEIEAAVEEVEGVEVSYTAACAVRVTGSNTDKLAIFFNPKLSDDDDLVSLLKEIRTSVVNSLGVNPDYLIPVDKEIIPKTSIGKIQRSQLSQCFNAGEFKPILKQIDILLGNANTIPDWFYRQVWKPKSPVTFNSSLSLINPTLVFLDSFGLGAYLCQILSQHNQPYITVSSGEDFRQISCDHYIISPGKVDHYRLLLESLAANNIVIRQILHLWTYDEYIGEAKSLEALEQAQEQGIYSLLFLIQALAKVQNSDHSIQLLFISSHIQSVSSTDSIAYEKSTVLGLLKTIPQELPWLNCRHIDLPFEKVETNGAYILQELQVPSKEREVAYRNEQRFVPRLEKVSLQSEPKHPIPFKQGGTYLLSGGLGGVGIQIAQYLLKYYQARLLLVGRTPLPEKSTWNTHLEKEDAISQRIKAYQELEQLGGEVIYETVDICDLKQLLTIVEKAEARWEKNLDGVIHLAGTFHEQLVLEETQENLAAVLRPKLLGSWALHQLIKDNADSIFINFSSLHGFFGSTAVGAYAAANSFLDRFSHYQKYESGLQSHCLVWSMWDETGMSQGYQMKNLIRAKGYYVMSSSQGISSMLAGLHHDQAHLFIGLDGSNPNVRRFMLEAEVLQKLTAYFTSKTSSRMTRADLQVRDRISTPITCDFVHLPKMPLTVSGEIDRERLRRGNEGRKSTESVAPRNEFERQLASLWQEVLGVPQVGIDENFFELGGNSIKAMSLLNKLQAQISQILHPTALFEAPTIAKFVAYLNEHYPEFAGKASSSKLSSTTWSSQKIEFDQIERMRRFLHRYLSGLSPSQEPQVKKNQPAIFILSPPRSGSTLLRVILGGHPQLFAPPELYLLSFNTLEERKATFFERNQFMGEGLIRALMEIKGYSVQEAQSLLQELEDKKLTTKQLYDLMQRWLPGKTLVDKTPPYAFNPEVLKRAEIYFENPVYIHLLRHPYGTIRSMEEAKIDRLLSAQVKDETSLSAREKAELIWLISHQNILEFLEHIPAHRQYPVKFEDLVQHPQMTVEGLCQFLDVDFHPDMLQPYKEKTQRMTDGLHSVSRMLGDPKFHTHQEIDAKSAEKWLQDYTVDFLSEETWQITESLGYERISLQKRKAEIPTFETGTYQEPWWGLDNEYPLSPELELFWLIAQLTSGDNFSPTFSIQNLSNWECEFDPVLFQRACDLVVERNEILRTRLIRKGSWVQEMLSRLLPSALKNKGSLSKFKRLEQVIIALLEKPNSILAKSLHRLISLKIQLEVAIVRQKVLPPQPVSWTYYNYEYVSNEIELQRIVDEIVTKERENCFDLERGPLLHCAVIKNWNNTHTVIVIAHHSFVDLMGIQHVSDELHAVYQALLRNELDSLVIRPQYRNYATRLASLKNSTSYKADIEFWQKHFAQCKPIVVPPQPDTYCRESFRISKPVDQETAALIHSYCQQIRLPVSAFFLAGYYLFLHQITGQSHLYTVVNHNTRSDLESEATIGTFLQVFPLVVSLAETSTVTDLIQASAQNIFAVLGHKRVSLPCLVSHDIPIAAAMMKQPACVFQVVQATQKPISTRRVPARRADISDWLVSIDIKASGTYNVAVNYNTAFYRHEYVENLFDRYQQILAIMAKNPQRPAMTVA